MSVEEKGFVALHEALAKRLVDEYRARRYVCPGCGDLLQPAPRAPARVECACCGLPPRDACRVCARCDTVLCPRCLGPLGARALHAWLARALAQPAPCACAECGYHTDARRDATAAVWLCADAETRAAACHALLRVPGRACCYDGHCLRPWAEACWAAGRRVPFRYSLRAAVPVAVFLARIAAFDAAALQRAQPAPVCRACGATDARGTALVYCFDCAAVFCAACLLHDHDRRTAPAGVHHLVCCVPRNLAVFPQAATPLPDITRVPVSASRAQHSGSDNGSINALQDFSPGARILLDVDRALTHGTSGDKITALLQRAEARWASQEKEEYEGDEESNNGRGQEETAPVSNYGCESNTNANAYGYGGSTPKATAGDNCAYAYSSCGSTPAAPAKPAPKLPLRKTLDLSTDGYVTYRATPATPATPTAVTANAPACTSYGYSCSASKTEAPARRATEYEYGMEQEPSTALFEGARRAGFAPVADEQVDADADADAEAAGTLSMSAPQPETAALAMPAVVAGDAAADAVRSPELVASLRALSRSAASPLLAPCSSSNGERKARNWNEEFQRVLQLPEASRQDERLKELQLFALILEFESAVKAIGARIVVETGLPRAQRTVERDTRVGGVAGGDKFVVDGIFFKFSTDRHNLYGGSEFAGKATAHELHGYNAYFRHAAAHAQAQARRLHVPLMAIIDYLGFRVAGMAQLPVDAATLHNGSADGGATVVADDPALAALMRAAGTALNLREHTVGRAPHTAVLCAPCDIEGHRGRDGRYYVLDAARVFPPEAVSRYFSAVLLPVRKGSNSSGSGDDDDDEDDDDVDEGGDQLGARELQLPVQGWEARLLEVLRVARLERVAFAGGVLCSTGGRVRNEAASVLVSRDVYGTAVVVPAGYHGRHLYNLLRPELVARAPVPLSSDAYTAFGRADAGALNGDVRRATQHLRLALVRAFAHDLCHRVFVAGARDVAAEMHRRGINLRYLALCYSHVLAGPRSAGRTRALHLLAAEMVARATKLCVRACLRERVARGAGAAAVVRGAKAAVVAHLNHALCLAAQWPRYWDVVVRLNLQRKYGQYVTTLAPDAWRVMRAAATEPRAQLLLLKAIQRALGIVFVPGLDTAALVLRTADGGSGSSGGNSSNGRAFVPDDIMRLDVLTQGRLAVLAQYEARTVLARNRVNVAEEADVADLRLLAVVQLLGEQSREAGVAHLQMALVRCLQRDRARAEHELAASLAAWPETPVELGAAVFYSVAMLVHDSASATTSNSDSNSRENNSSSQGSQGTDDVATQLRCLRNAAVLMRLENPVAHAAHPFEMLVLDALVRTLWAHGRAAEARVHAARFTELLHALPFVPPRATLAALFGRAVPFACSLDLAHDCSDRSDRSADRSDDSTAALVESFVRKAQLHRDLRRLLSPQAVLDSTLSYSVHNAALARANDPRDAALVHQQCTNETTETKTETAETAPPARARTYAVRVGETEVRALPELDGVRVVCLAAAPGGEGCFAVADDGTVFVWGANASGLLGLGHRRGVARPTALRGVLPRVRRVACSAASAFFLAAGGDVYACGANARGCLGTGDTRPRLTPALVATLEGEPCVDIAAGRAATYAVTADGRLFFWGRLTDDDDGDDYSSSSKDSEGETFPASLTPTEVRYFAGRGVVRVAAEGAAGIALDRSGLAHCWTVRRGARGAVRAQPVVPVVALRGARVVAVACAAGAFLAVTRDGRAHAWGANPGGVLATGTRAPHGTDATEDGTPVVPRAAALLAPLRPRAVHLWAPARHADADAATLATLVAHDGTVAYWGAGCAAPLPLPTAAPVRAHAVCTPRGDSPATIIFSCPGDDDNDDDDDDVKKKVDEDEYDDDGMNESGAGARTGPSVEVVGVVGGGNGNEGGDAGGDVVCLSTVRVRVGGDGGAPLGVDRVVLWPLRHAGCRREAPRVATHDAMRRMHPVPAAPTVELRVTSAGPCVVCLYALGLCDKEHHHHRGQQEQEQQDGGGAGGDERNNGSDSESESDSDSDGDDSDEDDEGKLRYRMVAQSRVLDVKPVVLPARLEVRNTGPVRVYDEVVVQFETLAPPHMAITGDTLLARVRCCDGGDDDDANDDDDDDKDPENDARTVYADVDVLDDGRLKGRVEVLVQPADRGTMVLVLAARDGGEVLVDAQGRRAVRVPLCNDSVIEGGGSGNSSGGGGIVVEVDAHELVPLQPTTVRWDLGCNVLGICNMLCWFRADAVRADAACGTLGVAEAVRGSLAARAPAAPGTYTVRFVRYTSAGAVQLLGAAGDVAVVARTNCPRVLAHPARVAAGTNFAVDVALDGSPVLTADFVQLVRAGATAACCSERITAPAAHLVFTAPAPGAYELWYSTLQPGANAMTVTRRSPLTIVPAGDCASSSSPSAVPAAAPGAAVAETFACWKDLLVACGLGDAEAGELAAVFEENELDVAQAVDLDADTLKELGVKMGPRLKILKYVRAHFGSQSQPQEQQES